MKKLLAGILALTMALSFCACDEDSDSSSDKSSNDSTSSQGDSSKIEDSSEDSSKKSIEDIVPEDWNYKFSEPYVGYSYYYKDDPYTNEGGGYKMRNMGDTMLFTYSYLDCNEEEVPMSDIKTVEEIIPKMKPLYQNTIDVAYMAMIPEKYEVTTDTSEVMTINEIEMCKNTGKIVFGVPRATNPDVMYEAKGVYVSYSFFVNGRPTMFMYSYCYDKESDGLEMDQRFFDAIEKEADISAQTVQTWEVD